MCSVLVSDGTCGAENINYTDEDGVFIIDGNKINYYDYKENKVVYSYDALKTSNSENFQHMMDILYIMVMLVINLLY